MVDKAVFAKIDRPAGIITFSAMQNASEVLQEWSSENRSLMRLVGKACHTIEKERMSTPLKK